MKIYIDENYLKNQYGLSKFLTFMLVFLFIFLVTAAVKGILSQGIATTGMVLNLSIFIIGFVVIFVALSRMYYFRTIVVVSISDKTLELFSFRKQYIFELDKIKKVGVTKGEIFIQLHFMYENQKKKYYFLRYKPKMGVLRVENINMRNLYLLVHTLNKEE